jgi:hypothetical protein
MLVKWLIILALRGISGCHKPTPILWHRLIVIFIVLNVALASCTHCLMEEENANTVRRNLLLDLVSIDCLKT